MMTKPPAEELLDELRSALGDPIEWDRDDQLIVAHIALALAVLALVHAVEKLAGGRA